MYYSAKKQPEELLKIVGFTPAPDQGWQISLQANSQKPRPSDYRTFIPHARIHALVFGQLINVHMDKGTKAKKHKAYGSHPKVLEIIDRLHQHDTK